MRTTIKSRRDPRRLHEVPVSPSVVVPPPPCLSRPSGTIRSMKTLFASLLVALATPVAADDLAKWAAAPHRTPANVARDGARHPLEALRFFGVEPHHTVVEILPGSNGYYLEIVAPYLRDKGRYIAANRDETAAPNYLADHQRLLQRLSSEPTLYGKVIVTKFNADRHEIVPPGSADFVL